MLAYLARRLLIIVPTYLGVLLMIWLVMTAAPGEPQGVGSEGGGAGGTALENVSNLEAQNRNVRFFREQFNLNRPRFYNDWTTLDPAEVRAELEVLAEGVARTQTDGTRRGHPPARVKEARRSLEDWGWYAVPALVGLLEETAAQPRLQDEALRRLREAAYTFRPVYPPGYRRTAADLERDRRIDAENRRLDHPELRWRPLAAGEALAAAAAEERAAVVARWRAWFEERQARWDFSLGDRIRIGLTDTQFGRYWANLLRGDLGVSSRTSRPVLGEILGRLKYSLSIAVPSFLIAWVLAVFLGVFSATRHGRVSDQSIGVGLFMLYSIPTFVAATLLQRWLCIQYGWFPLSGFESPNAFERLTTWEHFLDVLHHVTLPIVVYTYGSLAYISRQARSGMLEVLQADYVRTARAKGLSERSVVWKHAVRNGMMPLVTLLGTALPVLLAGSVFIEYVFAIDGFGQLMITSILNKDYNVVMGVQLIVAALTLIGLLLTDLLYAAMDPRISLK